jgi:predicted transcriptional regulator
MLHAKQEVQQLLSQLPENVSFDDIQYHIYVRQKINRGIEDIEAGNTIAEEEFDERMSRWIEP